MKQFSTLVILLIFSVKSYSCQCVCKGDCSFNVVSNTVDFVALVKIISFGNYLDYTISADIKKMPQSMIVEIVKKYKGSEIKQRIKIWGDNGMLCRPYISNFNIGDYYLIAPQKLRKKLEHENPDDYDFFSCSTDYLKVDMKKQMVYGQYSKSKSKIKFHKAEKMLNKL